MERRRAGRSGERAQQPPGALRAGPSRCRRHDHRPAHQRDAVRCRGERRRRVHVPPRL